MTSSPPPRPPSFPPPLDARRPPDRFVRWLARAHPVTASTLVWYGVFRQARAAGKCLRRLEEQGLLRQVGTCSRGHGRPEHAYCGRGVPSGSLPDEVRLTEVLRRLQTGELRRGPDVLDASIRPDAEFVVGEHLCYLEYDRGGSMESAAMQFGRYRDCPHPSFWLCPTAKRVEEVQQIARQVAAVMLFATWEEALAGPHRPIWRDAWGRDALLPTPTGQALPPV